MRGPGAARPLGGSPGVHHATQRELIDVHPPVAIRRSRGPIGRSFGTPSGPEPRGCGSRGPARRRHRTTGRDQRWDLDRLADVPLDGGDPDAKPGRQLRVRVATPQMRQGEQGPGAPESATDCLSPCALPPVHAQVAQVRGGWIDGRRVDNHTKLLARRSISVDNSSIRSFGVLQNHPTHSHFGRLEESHGRGAPG